jgi:hypothetical protein
MCRYYEGITKMNAKETAKFPGLSPAELAQLGGGALAYIREIEGKEAIRLIGARAAVPPEARLYCLYGADGTPVSISDSREAAIGSAFEHALMPMSVH